MEKATAFTDSEYTYLQDEVLEVLNSMVVVDSDAEDSEGMNYVYVAAIPENIAVLARLVPDVDEYVQQYMEDGASCDYETGVIDIQWAAWDCGAKWFDGEKFLLHAPLDLEVIKERVERATLGSWKVVKSDDKGVQIGTTWAHPQLKTAVAVVTTAKSLKGVTTYIEDDDAEFIAHARQDIPALIAEVERLRVVEKQAISAIEGLIDGKRKLRKENELFENVVELSEKRRQASEEENARLREALRFYADEANYKNISFAEPYSKVANDYGHHARVALGLDGATDE